MPCDRCHELQRQIRGLELEIEEEILRREAIPSRDDRVLDELQALYLQTRRLNDHHQVQAHDR